MWKSDMREVQSIPFIFNCKYDDIVLSKDLIVLLGKLTNPALAAAMSEEMHNTATQKVDNYFK